MNISAVEEQIKKLANETVQSYINEYFILDSTSDVIKPVRIKESKFYRFVVTYQLKETSIYNLGEIGIEVQDKDDECITTYAIPFVKLKKYMDNYRDNYFIRIDLSELGQIIPEKYKEVLKNDMISLLTRKQDLVNKEITRKMDELETQIKHNQYRLEEMKKAVKE